MKSLLLLMVVVAAPSFGLGGAEIPSEPGELVFTANGESFVRRGFAEKDGWQMTFDRLFVNLIEPTAYTPDGRTIVLAGSHWVDLAAGGSDAAPVEVGRVEPVAAANYQSLKFRLGRRDGGDYQGSSIVVIGHATRNGTTIPFTIRLSEEMDFDGREGYVGEELKGLVAPGGVSDVETTFHFDHIFGDMSAPAGDHVNANSVGFGFFLPFRKDGSIDVSQEDLAQARGYDRLVRAVWNLGHLGEGHCEVSGQSSAGEITP